MLSCIEDIENVSNLKFKVSNTDINCSLRSHLKKLRKYLMYWISNEKKIQLDMYE